MKEKNGKALWQQQRKRWEALDWRLTDRELGKQMNVSRERARQMRRDLGKPDSSREIAQKETLDVVARMLPAVRGKSVREAINILDGCLSKMTAVRRFLDANGVLTRYQSKHPWHLLNFKISNSELFRVWEIGISAIAFHRKRHNLDAPKWGGRTFSRVGSKANDPDYRKALIAEKKKAQRFKASQATTD